MARSHPSPATRLERRVTILVNAATVLVASSASVAGADVAALQETIDAQAAALADVQTRVHDLENPEP